MANLVRSAIRSLIAGACPDLITLWQCTPCDAARSEVETPLLDEAPRKYGRHEPCFVCNVGYNIRRDKERVEREAFDRLKAELQHAFAAPDASYQTLSAAEVIARNKA
jgi:hypothetical protein